MLKELLAKIANSFKLIREKERLKDVICNIENGVPFKGTNLWILIFAIFIASLGLNLGLIAVVIGAMLISPLMGPIIGLGLGMGINDEALLKKSIFNYLFAIAIGLVVSTIYFLLSPINDAHLGLLVRTVPTIYDVLIALFGGLAVIVATISKQKGNVIPGAAIATALMPPLCTAGYGIATWQMKYFFGAMYLFIINTVFIALASLFAVRLLKFPLKCALDEEEESRGNKIVWIVVLATLLPSIYFGYSIVQQTKFSRDGKEFIKNEAIIPGDYLLDSEIDMSKKEIVLIFGGKKINDEDIEILENKLKNYNLKNFKINIKQGFTSLSDMKSNEQFQQVYKTAEKMGVDFGLLKEELESTKSSDAVALGEMKNKVEDLEARLDRISPSTKKDIPISSSVDSVIVNDISNQE